MKISLIDIAKYDLKCMFLTDMVVRELLYR